MNIIKIKTTDSTNRYLTKLAEEKNLEEGTVVQAYSQTAGRGQAGTHWESEDGKNITCSILFYPSFLPARQNFLLSEVVALGIKDALEEHAEKVSIKWPNDVYIEDRKVAGTLIENELIGSEISRSIVGIGVNINQESFLSNCPNPVSLKQELGYEIDLDVFLESMVAKIFFWYEELRKGKYQLVARNYFDSLYRSFGYYDYKDKNGKFKAEIQSVEDNGMLHLITDQGEERKYFFKEVTFLNDGMKIL